MILDITAVVLGESQRTQIEKPLLYPPFEKVLRSLYLINQFDEYQSPSDILVESSAKYHPTIVSFAIRENPSLIGQALLLLP